MSLRPRLGTPGGDARRPPRAAPRTRKTPATSAGNDQVQSTAAWRTSAASAPDGRCAERTARPARDPGCKDTDRAREQDEPHHAELGEQLHEDAVRLQDVELVEVTLLTQKMGNVPWPSTCDDLCAGHRPRDAPGVATAVERQAQQAGLPGAAFSAGSASTLPSVEIR